MGFGCIFLLDFPMDTKLNIIGEITKYVSSKIGFSKLNKKYWILFKVGYEYPNSMFYLLLESKEINHSIYYNNLKVVSYMSEIDDCIDKFLKEERKRIFDIQKRLKGVKL